MDTLGGVDVVVNNGKLSDSRNNYNRLNQLRWSHPNKDTLRVTQDDFDKVNFSIGSFAPPLTIYCSCLKST